MVYCASQAVGELEFAAQVSIANSVGRRSGRGRSNSEQNLLRKARLCELLSLVRKRQETSPSLVSHRAPHIQRFPVILLEPTGGISFPAFSALCRCNCFAIATCFANAVISRRLEPAKEAQIEPMFSSSYFIINCHDLFVDDSLSPHDHGDIQLLLPCSGIKCPD